MSFRFVIFPWTVVLAEPAIGIVNERTPHWLNLQLAATLVEDEEKEMEMKELQLSFSDLSLDIFQEHLPAALKCLVRVGRHAKM